MTAAYVRVPTPRKRLPASGSHGAVGFGAVGFGTAALRRSSSAYRSRGELALSTRACTS